MFFIFIVWLTILLRHCQSLTKLSTAAQIHDSFFNCVKVNKYEAIVVATAKTNKRQ